MRLRCICELVLAKLNTNELSVSLCARATSSDVGAVSVASCHAYVQLQVSCPLVHQMPGSACRTGPGT